VFISIEGALAISILILALGFIAGWDMQASAVMIAIVTLIEVGGLILVITFAISADPIAVTEVSTTPAIPGTVAGVLLGGFIAFYAFIGFEDMVNIVEEVKEPERNMPFGIIVSVLIAIGLYFLVAMAALHVMPASELAQSEAPLADMMLASGGGTFFITLISLVAVINGALVQIIMASRVLYGMAGKDMAPTILGSINPQTQTPVVATAFVTSLVLIFALALPLTELAQLTSFIMLIIFALVNAALIVIKRRTYKYYVGINLPVFIPTIGAMTASMLLIYQVLSFIVF
jgi:amino acid transporter